MTLDADQIRILIVGDGSLLVESATHLLQAAGYRQISYAQPCAEAFSLAQALRPHLILLDASLSPPAILDFCQKFKADAYFTDALVVAQAYSTDDPDLPAKALECGADQFLTLPLSDREWLARLQALLRLPRLQADLVESEAFLRSIIASFDELVFVLDINRRFVAYYQPGKDHRLYVPAEQFMGKPITEIGLPGDLVASFNQAFDRLLTDDAVQSFDYSLDFPDGRQWFNAKIYRLLNSQQLITGCVVATRRITEQKRAEEELRLSQERYQALTELFSDIHFSFRLNQQGVFEPEWWTGRLRDVLGYDDEQIDALDWQELIYPEDMPLIIENMQRVLQGQAVSVESRLVISSGHTHWVRIGARPMWDDEHTRVVGFLAGLRDIQERKNTENALRQSEAKFRSLIHSSRDGFFLVDEQGMVIEWNPAMERLTGRVASQVLGCPMWQVHADLWPAENRTPHNLALLKEAYETMLCNGQGAALDQDGYSQLAMLQRPNGESYWVEMSHYAIPSGAGFMIGGAIRDVTERQMLIEQGLLQSRALDSSANAIVITDIQAHILWANPAFTRMTGYALAEVKGKKTSLFKSGLHDQAFYQRMWDTILSGDVWHGELINRRKDGTLYNEEITITPVKSPVGLIFQFIAVKQDITERKRAEQALSQYAADQQLLFSVASTAAAILDQDKLLASVLAVLGEALQPDFALIFVASRSESKPAYVVARPGLPDALHSQILRLFISRSTSIQIDEVIRDGFVSILGQGYSDLPGASELGFDLSQASSLCVPLVFGTRLLGRLSLIWRGKCPLLQPTQDLLLTIGRQIGLSMHNAQLYQAAWQVDRLQALNRIHLAATSSLEMPVVYRQLLLTLAITLGVYGAALLLKEKHSGDLVVEAIYTDDKSDAEVFMGRRLGRERGIIASVAQTGQTACINDVDQDPRFFQASDNLVGRKIKMMLCAPLHYQGKVIGVLLAMDKHQGEFGAEDIYLLEAAASLAAVAIENARLYSEMRFHVHELEILNNLSRSLIAHLDSAGRIEAALIQLKTLFTADVIAYVESDASSPQARLSRILPSHLEAALLSTRIPHRQLLHHLLNDRQSILIPHSAQDSRMANWVEQYPQLGQTSLIAAPLITPSHVIGVMIVLRFEPFIYTESHLRILESVASMVAVAVENARLYEDLKKALREREATQMQLVQAEKISALGRLAASLAHEINNPLQAVKGCLSLFDEEMEGARNLQKLDQYIHIINSEIDRIVLLVRRMREFYRPTGQAVETVHVHEILENILALSAKQIKVSAIALETDWMEPAPLVRINPDHLKQILMNLVINAVDAMPGGGVLHISTAMEASPLKDRSPMLRIQFKDTGVGMPPEVMGRLFTPFFSTKEHGSGLGLYISNEIIQSYGGKILAASEPGKGSTFTILLPVE